MPDPLPRWLLALAGIVALLAIYVGIKDYVERRNIPAQTSTVTSAVVSSAPVSRHKKTTSPKTKQAQESTNQASVRANAPGARDSEKPVVEAEFTMAGAHEAVLSGNGPDTASEQTPNDRSEMAIYRNNRGRNDLNTIAVPGSSGCLPLPNLTKPTDVDAPYYENWARAYCGLEQP